MLAERLDVNGAAFAVGAPDYWLVELEHASGTRVRLTVNFYVKGDEGVEFHGDEGSLRLGSWFAPGSSLVFTPYEGQSSPVSTPDAPEHVNWSVGVAELVSAIEEGRPSQLDRDRSVHLVEILEAAETSANTGSPVDLNTGFED